MQLQEYELKFRTNIYIPVYLSLLLLLLLLLSLLLLLLLHAVPCRQAFSSGERGGTLGTILCHKEVQTGLPWRQAWSCSCVEVTCPNSKWLLTTIIQAVYFRIPRALISSCYSRQPRNKQGSDGLYNKIPFAACMTHYGTGNTKSLFSCNFILFSRSKLITNCTWSLSPP